MICLDLDMAFIQTLIASTQAQIAVSILIGRTKTELN